MSRAFLQKNYFFESIFFPTLYANLILKLAKINFMDFIDFFKLIVDMFIFL
jgi:hypothetical protein